MAELLQVTSTGEHNRETRQKSGHSNTNHNGPEVDKHGLDNTAFHHDENELKDLPPSTPYGNSIDDTVDKDDDDDEDEEESSAFSRHVERIQRGVYSFYKFHSSSIWLCVSIILLIAYYTYFGFSMRYRFGDEGSWRLLICTLLASLGLVFHFVVQYRASGQHRLMAMGNSDEVRPSNAYLAFERFLTKIRIAVILPILLVIGFIVFLVVDVALDRPRNLISLGGLCFYIVFMFVFSHNPAKVKWRPVFWGITLQIIFAVVILRTSWGFDAFNWLGKRVTSFLANTDAGSKFVFGDMYEDHFFAFKVLPVVVFFSTFVSVMYYLGVMQAVIQRLGRFLSWCLGTSPAESVNAAGNIFIGQTEAPLLIRPFLADMTKSEIHAVMTGGFATVAGSVMAAYILYKVPANHLLSASVMSAPAALAISKLFWPETERPKNRGPNAFRMVKGSERNIVEAASNGASMSIILVANIAVNLIAFVAALQFINTTLVWFGDRIGYENFTFELVCSYVFWPLAFLMGVGTNDCRVVAELIGIKTFLNEFVAYVHLSEYIKNQMSLDQYLHNATVNATDNLTGHWHWTDGNIYLVDTNTTLIGGIISERSVVISTYALCGFSNLASMGVQLGGLGALAPSRKSDMSKIVVRAMIAGNVACFMTACIAGLFYESDQ